ncbi:MAG: hypothetical protein J0I11_19055 [Actinobacteria bacterium]|nr:hypothetical protein [Actinomycetota bacterium]
MDRFRLSGCGCSADPPLELDSDEELEDVSLDDELEEVSLDDELDDDCCELDDDELAASGFWVLAPQAATMLATATAATRVVTRVKRDISDVLS